LPEILPARDAAEVLPIVRSEKRSPRLVPDLRDARRLYSALGGWQVDWEVGY